MLAERDAHAYQVMRRSLDVAPLIPFAMIRSEMKNLLSLPQLAGRGEVGDRVLGLARKPLSRLDKKVAACCCVKVVAVLPELPWKVLEIPDGIVNDYR